MPQANCPQCGSYVSSWKEHFCSIPYFREGPFNPNWRGGKTNHPYYQLYNSMMARCFNKNDKAYYNYGGRGISVCKRWVDDFWTFVLDMGPRPDKYVLDRIDNEGNYEPSNCRWANRSTSSANRRMENVRNRVRNELGRFVSV